MYTVAILGLLLQSDTHTDRINKQTCKQNGLNNIKQLASCERCDSCCIIHHKLAMFRLFVSSWKWVMLQGLKMTRFSMFLLKIYRGQYY